MYSTKQTAALAALGCKVNKYEIDTMAEHLKQAGYEIVDIDSAADLYIINTCTVTNMSDKKSRQLIRKVRGQKVDAIVVAAGCYAQVAPEDVRAISGVDVVIGTGRTSDIVSILNEYKTNGSNVFLSEHNQQSKTYESTITSGQNSRTRAYVKVQDGCDNFCAYCIIPYARGRVRSRQISDVLEEVRAHGARGVKEIIITGIHVASYGKDFADTGLLDLIRAVHDIDGIERIRLSSLEPNIITEHFINTLASFHKVCGYFHLSLQSGSDTVLAAMNRKYDTLLFQNAVNLVYKAFPDAAVWTDVIAGFPGETEEDFENGFNFIKTSGIVNMHVFPFSPKKGTKAYNMPFKVDNKTKSARAKRLTTLAGELYFEYLNKNIGKTLPVLIERCTDNGIAFEGHTKNNICVEVSGGAVNINEIVDISIINIDNNKVTGVYKQ